MVATRSHDEFHLVMVTNRSQSQSHSGSRSSRIVPVDSEKDKRFVKPGDHIAVERWDGAFEHHGIYEGKGKGYPSVIHFQGPLKSSNKPSETCINKCGYERSEDGKVVTSCINCFSQGKLMFMMQYMLQENLLSAKDIYLNELKPGKLIKGYRSKKYYREYYKNGQLHGHSIVSTKKDERSKLDRQVLFYPEFSNRTSQKVLQVAREYKPAGKYSVVCNNCEHFATFCKTGKKMSKQSQKCNAEKTICENGKRKPFFKSSSKNEPKRRKLI